MRASEKRASSEANAAEREIFETRIVDASRELVWELGTKTKISMRMVFDTAELRNRTDREHGAVEGLKQTLARLGEQAAKIPVIVERTFDAPVDRVWKAITAGDRGGKPRLENRHGVRGEVRGASTRRRTPLLEWPRHFCKDRPRGILVAPRCR